MCGLRDPREGRHGSSAHSATAAASVSSDATATRLTMSDAPQRSVPDPAALARCLEGIRHPLPQKARSWAESFASSVQRALRWRAAEFHARRHFAEHGRLPEGPHHVVVRVGPGRDRGDADIAHPFHTYSVPRSERVLAVDITFPAALPSPPSRGRPGSRGGPPVASLERREQALDSPGVQSGSPGPRL